MSRIRGAPLPPDLLTRLRMSSGAPHARHDSADFSFIPWHHWHWMRSNGSAAIGGLVIFSLPAIVADALRVRSVVNRLRPKHKTHRRGRGGRGENQEPLSPVFLSVIRVLSGENLDLL